MTTPARKLWVGFETIHAVTYFHPICLEAFTEAGTKGFWMGYFAGRMAPMGPVGPEVATAVCFGFAPTRAARALPDAWRYVTPEQICVVRAQAAASALRAVVADLDTVAAELVEPLDALVAGLTPAGRALAAGNLGVAPPEDAVARVWQHCTTLREHRGDGHVAAWVAHGFDGLASNVLSCASAGRDAEDVRPSRDWTPEQWATSADALVDRGLLRRAWDGGFEATDAGRAVHAAVETATDELAAASYAGSGADELASVADRLRQVATRIAAAGALRFPNPIGLPPA